MAAEPETIELLARAVSQTGEVIAAIPADTVNAPTPCHEWSVGELVHHIVGQSMPNFVVAARGEKPDWQATALPLSDGWTADFNGHAQQLMDHWRAVDPSRLPQMQLSADQQIAELAMHAWDLAKATGHPVASLDDRLAEHALTWSRGVLRPEYRGTGRGFDAEVPVPEDAPAHDRLAGWFGRDPNWSPDGRLAAASRQLAHEAPGANAAIGGIMLQTDRLGCRGRPS